MIVATNNEILGNYIHQFKEDFEQYWNYGKIERAYELNKTVSNDPKKIVRYDMPPHPFYGNLFAETVMVNLNAGIPSDKVETPKELSEKGIKKFEDYYNYLFNFGEIRYFDGASVDGFDAKQIAFLLSYDQKSRQLGFDYLEDTNKTSSYIPNLRKLLSNRCQLELIPYGSTRFDTKDFKNEQTLSYLKKLIGVICSIERKIAFFNGSIFRYLLKMCRNDFQVEISPKIGEYLVKKDGTVTKNKYYYSYGTLMYYNRKIPFVISDSFAQQGLNGDLMRQYGELVTREVFKNLLDFDNDKVEK